jgi:hypothetical protein
MMTEAGWYDEQGKQLLVATESPARACFLIREAVGLITNMAASPTASSASNVLKAQWSPVRAVLTKPFPASIRSYGENWQIEVISDPTQSASLAFKMDGNDNIINLSALSAPAQELISYAVIDTMLFRNQPAQLLEVSVNGTYQTQGLELPRALRDANYYAVDDHTSTYLWAVEENRLRAYSRASGNEVAQGTHISDSFNLFVAGHLY